jgi:tetratricopeptide (TPR) repeat protein
MTVRDAADTLPRLAASLDGVIDEWFIIDVESSDDTAEVVRRAFGHLPGTLMTAAWAGHRANAESLVRQAGRLPGPSHLLLVGQDAVVEALPEFRFELASLDAHLVSVPVRHGGLEHYQPAIVRVGPEWTYGTEGYMQLQAVAPVASSTLDSLRIVVVGDRSDRDEVLNEVLQQLLTQISANPQSPDLAFEVALHHRDLGDYERAIEAFRHALDTGAGPAMAFFCHFQIGEIHQLQGRYPEGLWSYLDALQWDPERVETYHRIGRLLNAHARWEAARVWLEQGARQGRSPRGLFPEPWVSAWGIDFELAVARWWTGDQESAQATFRWLLERPDLPAAFREACEHNLRLGSQSGS